MMLESLRLSESQLKERIHLLKTEIADAAIRSGRRANAVELLVAGKYLSAEQLEQLANVGIELVGGNQAQALIKKSNLLGSRLRWHFIGQLQSRKVAAIVDRVELIHSVASESALKALTRYGNADTKILLQVDVANEQSKSGIDPQMIPEYLDRAEVSVVGLMTMPPATEVAETNRRYFAQLAELADKYGLQELSMGTSQDFRVAIEEGATIVRLGRYVFDH